MSFLEDTVLCDAEVFPTVAMAGQLVTELR